MAPAEPARRRGLDVSGRVGATVIKMMIMMMGAKSHPFVSAVVPATAGDAFPSCWNRRILIFK